MLLNLKVKNFKSFRNETVFTMLASMQKTHNDYIINKTISGNKLKVLPMSVIYGANASGKSNIVLAMYILKKMITEGTLDSKELDIYKNVLSFIRDESWYEPIELEITFSTCNNIYIISSRKSTLKKAYKTAIFKEVQYIIPRGNS